MRLTCYSLAAIVLCSTIAPIQAETWSGKRTAYRMPGGQWTKARIEVNPGSVEVFKRKDATVVARFEKGSFELKGGRISGTGVQRKTSISRTALGGAAGFFGVVFLAGGVWTIATNDRSTPPAGRLAALLVGVAGVATSIALFRSARKRRPYFELADGLETIELRPGKNADVFRNDIRAALGE